MLDNHNYMVFAPSDVQNYLSAEEQALLLELHTKCAVGRQEHGLPSLVYSISEKALAKRTRGPIICSQQTREVLSTVLADTESISFDLPAEAVDEQLAAVAEQYRAIRQATSLAGSNPLVGSKKQ